MKALFKAFREPEILDKEIHADIKIKKPENYAFMEDVEIVPVVYSELMIASIYCPVFFGISENTVFPFAVLGAGGRNVFVRDDGSWKIDFIPKLVELYPFGLIREGDDYIVIIDKSCHEESGERLFNNGDDTEFFSSQRNKITEVARDLNDAIGFCNELVAENLLKPMNLSIDLKCGKASLKNMLVLDIEKFNKISPEKLWSINSKGYLLVLLSHYLSLRNFQLFDFYAIG